MPASNQTKKLPGFDAGVQIASTSFSGDVPNPTLSAFVEEHSHQDVAERTDKGDLDAEVATYRGSSFFSLHKYWSKKGHEAIREYLAYFTSPGDLVLDRFVVRVDCQPLLRKWEGTQLASTFLPLQHLLQRDTASLRNRRRY